MIYEHGWWKSEGESQFCIIYCVFEDCGWLPGGDKEDMHTTSLVSLQSSCVGSYSMGKEPVDDES